MPMLRSLPCSLILTLSALTPAFAQEFRVTTEVDSFDERCDSHCSLRDAIHQANRTPGQHLIRLPAGTYRLSLTTPGTPDDREEDENRNGDLDVYGQFEVRGAGPDRTIIDGLSQDRLFDVLEEAELKLTSLTLRNGRHAFDGGALRNAGYTVLRQVVLENNRVESASEAVQGGAIANYGLLDIYRSELRNNVARSLQGPYSRGGAIFNALVLQVRDSRLQGNQALGGRNTLVNGGALYSFGSADVARVLLLSNRSDGDGSAISNQQMGLLRLVNATLRDNRGAGATVNNGQSAGPLAQLGLIHVTLVQNTGGGLDNQGDLRARNSLLLGNRDGQGQVSNCQDGKRGSVSARGLMVDPSSPCKADLRIADGELFRQVLQAFHDEGQLHAGYLPRPRGMAVDAVFESCPSHDQRSLPRPVDGNGDGDPRCDLGSLELTAPPARPR